MFAKSGRGYDLARLSQNEGYHHQPRLPSCREPLINANPNKIMGSVETFESLEDFNACLQQYEGDTNTKFIVLKSDRAFGRNGSFHVIDVLMDFNNMCSYYCCLCLKLDI